MAEESSPVQKLLDLALYAPLGALLVVREQLPTLVERGRHYLGTQINDARIAGPGPQPRRDEPANNGVWTPPSPSRQAAEGDGRVNGESSGSGSASTEPVSSAHLAIPGYDALSASQVVQRLGGLTPDELAAVGEYETATRGRRTILSKIDQLQSGA